MIIDHVEIERQTGNVGEGSGSNLEQKHHSDLGGIRAADDGTVNRDGLDDETCLDRPGADLRAAFCAIEAFQISRDHGVGATIIEIDRCGKDRFGRTLAYIRVSGTDVGEILIRAQVAVRWNGRRHEWCGQL